MSNKVRSSWSSAGNEEPRQKKISVGRTSSNIIRVERIPLSEAAPRYRTATPALMERWRMQRTKDEDNKDQETIISDADEESGEYTMMNEDAPPVDMNMVYSESFDDVNNEELRVKIVKDQLRLDLLELMRSNCGNVHILESIENGSVSVETIKDTYISCTNNLERNIALLWSAFMKRNDFVEALLNCGADINYCEPNEGFSALHLSAFSGCVSTVKYLISKGANVNYALRNYSPLHSAAFGNSAITAQILISNGARTDMVGITCDGGSTAIESAIKANSVDCVQLLAKYCTDINSIEPTGAAPIHIAADLGHSQCLQVLLDITGIDVNVKTRKKSNTALHLAAESGNSECISILLSKHAEADAKNAKGQTPLHLAAKSQSLECVETLMKTGGCNPNVVDNDNRTPLHCAVGRATLAFEITEALISWRADVNVRDKYGYTPLHIAALNELSQCVETLIFHGADVTAKTRGGVTALGIIVRKTPASLTMFYNNLDRAISMHDPEDSNREVELKLDFRSILQHRGIGEISFLNTFVEDGQKQILEHPLCEAFLYLKWEKIRKYFIGRLLFYAMFVIFLTAYVLMALAHNGYNSGKKKHSNETTTTSSLSISARTSFNVLPLVVNTTNSTEGSNTSAIADFLRNPTIIEYVWYILMVFTFAEMFRKFYGIAGYQSFKQYILHFENLVEWFVIIAVFAISCVFTSKTYVWQNHVAGFAVLCAWYNLMVMIGQLPLFGSYVAMYTKVLEEFAKLGLAYICLLIGFTVSFCVVFPSNDEFENPFIGIINILVMMTGEIDMDLLVKTDGSSLLLGSAHLIYVAFVLLVTIVLMNLLVGIAVNDIQGLKKTAGLSKLVRQTQLINYIERAMFNHMLPKYVVKILSLTALVSPSAYRVVLQVKPLNPRETRLPKEILASAYELAKSRRVTSHTLSSKGSNLTGTTFNTKSRAKTIFQSNKSMMRKFGRQESEVANLQTEVEESAIALERLREEMQGMRTVIQSLVDALNIKKEDEDM